jgi:hypothetical protein
MAVTLLTVAEYARHRACDEKAVRKALQEGRITRISQEKRCIDPDVADIQWAKNTRARGDSGSKAKGAGGNQPAQPPEGAGGGEDYSSMRARRERAEAMMAEIELAKASGTVLDRESSIRAIFTKFRELRDDAAGLGRRLAPQLVPMRDEREIRIAIDRALAECFDSFAKRQLQSLSDRLHGKATPVPPDLVNPPAVDEEPAA